MKKIKKKIIQAALLGGTIASGVVMLYNAYNWHAFDKGVGKYIELANGSMVAAKQEGILSMEECLNTANENAKKWAGKNTGIIWKTPYTDVDTFRILTRKASQRCREIGQLEEALRTGDSPKHAADWVKQTVDSLHTSAESSPLMKRLAYSEGGQTIACAYKALIDIIAGGANASLKHQGGVEDRSLDHMLNIAKGGRSIIRFQADDYMKAYDNTKIAVINADMGYLADAVKDLRKAYELIEAYPDEKNLALIRNVITMNQGALEGSILGAMSKLKELDNVDPSLKYSAGWWDQVHKMTESVGGHNVPCLTDFSGEIEGGYAARFWLGLGLTTLLGYLTNNSKEEK